MGCLLLKCSCHKQYWCETFFTSFISVPTSLVHRIPQNMPSSVSHSTQNPVHREGWGVVMKENQERTLQVSSIPLASMWCTAPPPKFTHTHIGDQFSSLLLIPSPIPLPLLFILLLSSTHLTPSASHHPSHKISTDGPAITHIHVSIQSILSSTSTQTHTHTHIFTNALHSLSRLCPDIQSSFQRNSLFFLFIHIHTPPYFHTQTYTPPQKLSRVALIGSQTKTLHGWGETQLGHN